MTAYKYITSKTAAAFSRLVTPKTEIVIHHWGVDGQSHDGVVNFFARPGTKTSAHYVISDGLVNCLVAPKHVAYHAGNWAVNLRSYGLECRPEMSDGDLETVAQVIADIWKSHKRKLKITYHKKYKNTACPGRYMKKLDWLEKRATEIYEGKTSATFYVVKPGDNLTLIASKHKTSVSKLVKLNGIKDKNKITVGQRLRVK